jgi:hypothetical protein
MVGWTESDLTILTSSSSEAPCLSAWVEQHDLNSDLTPPETMSMRFAKHMDLGDASLPLILGDFEFSDLMWADLCVCPMTYVFV